MAATQQPDPFGAPPAAANGPRRIERDLQREGHDPNEDPVNQGARKSDPEFAYYVLLEGGAKGQTVGKMAVGIRVYDLANGGSIGYGRAFIRYVGRYVSAIVILLGYLWMIWDKEKQTWHDKFAGSVVVPTSAYPVG